MVPSEYPYDKLPLDSVMNVFDLKFNSGDVITLKGELSEDLKHKSRYFFVLDLLLDEIEAAGELKLTAAGNLQVKTCKKIMENYKKGGFAIHEYTEEHFRKEEDWGLLNITKINLELSDLVKKRGGKLSFTQKGKKAIANRANFYVEFLKIYFQKYNWAYGDMLPENIGQYGAGFLLFLLHKYGNEGKSVNFYTEKYQTAFPEIIEDVPENQYFTTEEKVKSAIERRFFGSCLDGFGMITYDVEKVTKYRTKMINIKPTPIFDSIFSFNVKETKNPQIPSKMKGMHDLGSPMRDLHKVIDKIFAQNQFETIEEANAFLGNNMTGKTPEQIAEMFNLEETPEDKAEKLIAQAYDTDDELEQAKLIKEATAEDEDNPEIFMFKARNARTPEESLKWCQKAMDASKKRIGSEFEELKGHFWMATQTRPYMTAKAELADILAYLKFYKEAIREYQEMLELNPNDNQGIRDFLFPLLLLQKDYGAAEKLYKDFIESGSGTWAYGIAFCRFLRLGSNLNSRSLLKKAFKTNEFFPQIIFQAIEAEEDLPGYRGIGDEAEGQWMFRAFYPLLDSKQGEKIIPWLGKEVEKFLKKKFR